MTRTPLVLAASSPSCPSARDPGKPWKYMRGWPLGSPHSAQPSRRPSLNAIVSPMTSCTTGVYGLGSDVALDRGGQTFCCIGTRASGQRDSTDDSSSALWLAGPT
jgi:hypothetical protein